MLRSLFFLGSLIIGLSCFAQNNGQFQKRTFIYKDTLALDFYDLKHDESQKKPLIILVHGGGFSGGMRDGSEELKFCSELVNMGYAVASISYRLTRKGGSFSCDCPARTKMETFVMASEDLADATDFLVSEKKLDFDRNTIVLVGSSAGAETVLNSVYLSDHYEFKHLKKIQIKGVISFAGALINDDYITSNNAIPALLIHGKKDKLVPYTTDAHHFCSPDQVGYMILSGSESIANKLDQLNTSYILAYDPEGTHDWAGEAYKHTELVQGFIDEVIVQSKFVQSRVMIEKSPVLDDQ